MRCARFVPYKSPLRPTHALASRLCHYSAASTTRHPTLPYLAVYHSGGFSANGVAGLLATGAPINRDVRVRSVFSTSYEHQPSSTNEGGTVESCGTSLSSVPPCRAQHAHPWPCSNKRQDVAESTARGPASVQELSWPPASRAFKCFGPSPCFPHCLSVWRNLKRLWAILPDTPTLKLTSHSFTLRCCCLRYHSNRIFVDISPRLLAL